METPNDHWRLLARLRASRVREKTARAWELSGQAQECTNPLCAVTAAELQPRRPPLRAGKLLTKHSKSKGGSTPNQFRQMEGESTKQVHPKTAGLGKFPAESGTGRPRRGSHSNSALT